MQATLLEPEGRRIRVVVSKRIVQNGRIRYQSLVIIQDLYGDGGGGQFY